MRKHYEGFSADLEQKLIYASAKDSIADVHAFIKGAARNNNDLIISGFPIMYRVTPPVELENGWKLIYEWPGSED